MRLYITMGHVSDFTEPSKEGKNLLLEIQKLNKNEWWPSLIKGHPKIVRRDLSSALFAKSRCI